MSGKKCNILQHVQYDHSSPYDPLHSMVESYFLASKEVFQLQQAPAERASPRQ